MDSSKQRAYMFVDGSNFFYALRDEGWRIDWERFLSHFRATYEVVEAYYYEGTPTLGVFFDSNPTASKEDFKEKKAKLKAYHKRLKGFGYTVRTKPVGRLYDRSEGKLKHKCNFDVELTVDALDQIDNYEVCILGSGDGDFDKLIRYLKGRFKQVIVVAYKDYLSYLLKPNKTIYLGDLRSAIEITWAQP